MRKLWVLAFLLMSLAACSTTHTVRYTWGCPHRHCGQIEADTHTCIRDANRVYVPLVASYGNSIRKTVFKDCMESLGYTKLETCPPK